MIGRNGEPIPGQSLPGLEWIEYDADFVHTLQRVLAFTGWSPTDVLCNPLARNEVRHYLRVSRLIERREEVLELEEQWNPLGRSE
ncbi:MAG: hypothetical protein AAF743_10525 [Planctomycetota bacterium]